MKHTMFGVGLARKRFLAPRGFDGGGVEFPQEPDTIAFSLVLGDHASAVAVMEACVSASYDLREISRWATK